MPDPGGLPLGPSRGVALRWHPPSVTRLCHLPHLGNNKVEGHLEGRRPWLRKRSSTQPTCNSSNSSHLLLLPLDQLRQSRGPHKHRELLPENAAIDAIAAVMRDNDPAHQEANQIQMSLIARAHARVLAEQQALLPIRSLHHWLSCAACRLVVKAPSCHWRPCCVNRQ